MTLVSPAVQDVIANQFLTELNYGIDDYPDGTSERRYAEVATLAMDELREAARVGATTFAHFMTAQFYKTLECEDPDRLRHHLTALLVQGVQWREALDRRKAAAE